MRILALDTSTNRASLALIGVADGPVTASPDPSLRHGRGVVPAIRDLLHRAGLRVADLDGIAVGLGPGSFTGLRVGVTAAKTLAYAAKCPLAGFDSLEAIAAGAPAGSMRLAVAVDAQRGDVFAAEFLRPSPGAFPQRLSPTRVEPKARWLSRLEAGTLILGPDLARLVPDLPAGLQLADAESGFPRASAFAELALAALAGSTEADPWSLEPVYLRRSAAEDQWDAPNRARPA